MENQGDNTLLARWLSNDLSDQELQEFKSSEAYFDYLKIAAATDNILPESFDTDAMYERVLSSEKYAVSNSHQPNKRRYLWWYSGAAAAITLVLAFLFLINQDNVHTTGYGENLIVSLPDNSEMHLNARSKGIFNEGNWEKERTISLEGEAYFSVESGSAFTVETKLGNITVLGTKFNVQVVQDLFIVTCYEGKVSVYQNESNQVLMPGESFRMINGEISQSEVVNESPSWMSNESSYVSIPVKYVLLALESQFEINFQFNDALGDQLYTGSFPHGDQQAALNIVLGALEIEYEIKGNKTIMLK